MRSLPYSRFFLSYSIFTKLTICLCQDVLDAQAVETRMVDYIQHVPMAAGSLGIRVENKALDMGDIARVAKDRLFVKIKPP
ncbi:MAG TPA: hypothetical protein VGA72_06895 [Anaerolineales bacterium]